MSLIASSYGFADYRALYDHGDNAALKRKRPNPNVLEPGDVVMIPERRPKVLAIATGQAHQFSLRVARKVLRLRLLDHDAALAGEPYTLTVGSRARAGRTDGDGCVETSVSPSDTTALLAIAGRTLRLRLRHLNPLAEASDCGVSGAQARLCNLGYRPGPIDGKQGPKTRSALALFQLDEELPPTGELDNETRRALERAHGC